MNLFDMRGRTVIVVGGAGYLALPACKQLAAFGADVVVADRSGDRLEIAASEIRTMAPTATIRTHEVDIGDETAIEHLIRKTLKTNGRIDGLVNAAAASAGKTFNNLTANDFNHANAINLTGFFLLARAAAEKMPAAGGSIVMISSMYGIVAPDPKIYRPPMQPNPVEYGTAKAGMLQMTRYLAAHYGPRAIRVNAIAPGPFPKPGQYPDAPDFLERLASKTMLGRIGKSDEIAGAVTYLISDASRFVTGHCLRVDGGWTQW